MDTLQKRFGTLIQKALPAKSWKYFLISGPEAILFGATIDLGYAANAFATLISLGERRVVADISLVGLPKIGFGSKIRIDHHPDRFSVRIRTDELIADATLKYSVASPLDVDAGKVRTRKVAFLSVTGEAIADGNRYDLDGTHGALDLTRGVLPRLTEWLWAFGTGSLPDGTLIAFNLALGNNLYGANENALWIGARLVQLDAPAQFEFDKDDVLKPWRVRATSQDGHALDLAFDPVGAHREQRDLVVVRSRFAQVGGTFKGTLTRPGQAPVPVTLQGVTEDQSVRW